jgi:rhamnose transport system ATP-binding protein
MAEHPNRLLNTPLLRAIAVSKSYAGVRALRDVSFELRSGEVHALVGENGAGKSTLIKIFTGAASLDSGSVEVEGRRVEDNSPTKAKQLGIAAIYQHPALFPNLTVAENLAIRLEDLSGWKRVRWDKRRRRSQALLSRIGAQIDPDAEVGGLSMPEQQLVEIACAVGAAAKIVIMDEPTASLPAREAEALFRTIAGLRAQSVGIIYISHRLEDCRALPTASRYFATVAPSKPETSQMWIARRSSR